MKSVTNRAFMAKKMYSKPQTETMPIESASVLCASDGNHVSVNNTPQNDLIID